MLLPQVLEHCVRSLNPQIPVEVVAGALQRFQASRRSMAPVQANYTVYSMIKNGIAVEYEDERGEKQHETLCLIDFNSFAANTFTPCARIVDNQIISKEIVNWYDTAHSLETVSYAKSFPQRIVL